MLLSSKELIMHRPSRWYASNDFGSMRMMLVGCSFREHDILLGVSACCSCFACMRGMGRGDGYTVANVEVCRTR